MTISTIYYQYGHEYQVPTIEETEITRRLEDFPHDLEYCPDCNGVVLFDFRGAFAFGGTIEQSNASALDDLHNVELTYLHNEKLCITLWQQHLIDEKTLVILEELLEVFEDFQDYGLLDERDWSQRSLDYWHECVNNALSYALEDFDELPEEKAEEIVNYLTENYFGHSDEGYIANEWISEALEACGLSSDLVA